MAYTITSIGTKFVAIAETDKLRFEVSDRQAKGLYIQGEYTIGDETATKFNVYTRRTATGDDTPVYVKQVGTDGTMVQFAPTWSETARFDIYVPLLPSDLFVVVEPALTAGSATGTVAFDYAELVF